MPLRYVGQLQWNLFTPSMQVPPFKHGLLEHSFISKKAGCVIKSQETGLKTIHGLLVDEIENQPDKRIDRWKRGKTRYGKWTEDETDEMTKCRTEIDRDGSGTR